MIISEMYKFARLSIRIDKKLTRLFVFQLYVKENIILQLFAKFFK